ncbi:MAG: hypothetical protein V7L31_06570 [Nostoc sp.]|uniref:hypothetical protein n=1 Tax=Nostoc sp. TaxID=1180 RepID=UPI002FF14399
MSRDAELVSVEAQIRAAIRDCVNRTSRKPWRLGGIEGYQQLSAIGKYLLAQIQQVPVTEYKIQRRRLALSEAPRQQKHRLHHDPVSAIQSLVHQHQEILSVLESQALSYQLDS